MLKNKDMRVLLPDLKEFHELADTGKHSVPGVKVDFYTKSMVPEGLADGVVMWLASDKIRQQLANKQGLKWALTLTAGIDHVQNILPSQVALYNANRLHDRAVALHVVTGMLSATRNLHRFRDLQHQQDWKLPEEVIRADSGLETLFGKKVMIWGFGHIGQIVEGLLAPFGPEVLGVRSSTPLNQRDQWLAEADWVVLLLPHTPQTEGIVDDSILRQMKPGAWLSNQGRGTLVKTDHLLEFIQNRHLGGAILDVTDPEPLPVEHPLWKEPNVIITPHIASTTTDMIARGAVLTRDFLLDMQQGREPQGQVGAGRMY